MKEIRQHDPGYTLPESDVNGWGYQLLHDERYSEAIAVFGMNVVMYPKSANVYDSLGEAFMTAGQREPAIENYERALELDPDNTNAKERLEILRSSKELRR